MHERGLLVWIREPWGCSQDLNYNKGGGGATPKAVAKCGGSAWFSGGPTEVVLARVAARSKRTPVRAAGLSAALRQEARDAPQRPGLAASNPGS
jgi:hypothetical protein